MVEDLCHLRLARQDEQRPYKELTVSFVCVHNAEAFSGEVACIVKVAESVRAAGRPAARIVFTSVSPAPKLHHSFPMISRGADDWDQNFILAQEKGTAYACRLS